VYVDGGDKFYGVKVDGTTSYPIHASWDGSSLGSAIFAQNVGTAGDAIQAVADGTGRSAIYARGNSGVSYAVYSEANNATYAGYFDGKLRATHSAEGTYTAYVNNSSSTGTGMLAAGEGQAAHFLSGGSGAAFTGYDTGLYVRANRTGNNSQKAIYAKQASGEIAYVNYTASDGTHYLIHGDGTVGSSVFTTKGRRAIVTPHSPEAWIDDYGSGEIVKGKGHVDLDPLYLDCVTISEQYPMKVFVQLTSPMTNQFYVKKGTTGFDVIVTGEGAESVSATFDWRVVAKWKGYEHIRFVKAEEPEKEEVLQVEATEQSVGE